MISYRNPSIKQLAQSKKVVSQKAIMLYYSWFEFHRRDWSDALMLWNNYKSGRSKYFFYKGPTNGTPSKT